VSSGGLVQTLNLKIRGQWFHHCTATTALRIVVIYTCKNIQVIGLPLIPFMIIYCLVDKNTYLIQ
jgi:uncharacterized protein YdeI (YjbR/CyaY-like superfamily)